MVLKPCQPTFLSTLTPEIFGHSCSSSVLDFSIYIVKKLTTFNYQDLSFTNLLNSREHLDRIERLYVAVLVNHLSYI